MGDGGRRRERGGGATPGEECRDQEVGGRDSSLVAGERARDRLPGDDARGSEPVDASSGEPARNAPGGRLPRVPGEQREPVEALRGLRSGEAGEAARRDTWVSLDGGIPGEELRCGAGEPLGE
ncbi:hypothetical protein E2C01_066156 [Portunus trituberculatus]|uniref:Uncharacterized protein n=1 Tax=Portunus trituberculatus TaxID=210409 RepID=A0A5B7HPI7_PORTR|nr:hypothetical protein [Portunus trituberculatus]